eukprot:gene10234-8151_t
MASPAASGGVLNVAWQRYLFQLQKRPIRTKAITGACIAGVSDVIAQRILHGQHKNWKRTIAMALYGLIWSSPSAHYWQKFMDMFFQGKSDVNTVAKKVVLDQLTFGPLSNFMFMSFATLVLEGQSMAFLKNKLSNDFWGVQYGANIVQTVTGDQVSTCQLNLSLPSLDDVRRNIGQMVTVDQESSCPLNQRPLPLLMYGADIVQMDKLLTKCTVASATHHLWGG